MRTGVALAIMLGACYHDSSLRDCTVACTTTNDCFDGLTCSSEGLCRPTGATGTCATTVTPDASDAPVAAGTCMGSGEFAICSTATPPALLVLPATIYTSSDTGVTVDPNCLDSASWHWQGAGRPDACVMFAATVRAGAHTSVYGARPLVVLATGSITLASGQVLDVASHQGARLSGPGASSGTCASFVSPPRSTISLDNGASGGGAGGTFATGTGGSGGNGDADPSSAGGVAASAPASVTVLTAGCTGQTGPGGSMSTAAPGGAGGGAVYLASQSTIAIAGIINASGSGGTGGGNVTGGGGGGAGGMIVIDAPTITATGTIVANGGGGASGGYWTSIPSFIQAYGSPGSDPDPTNPATPAAGGTIGGNAGSGGAGYAMGQAATAGAAGTNFAGNGYSGGGGGGGSGGAIIAPASSLSAAIVSPPPVTTGL